MYSVKAVHVTWMDDSQLQSLLHACLRILVKQIYQKFSLPSDNIILNGIYSEGDLLCVGSLDLANYSYSLLLLFSSYHLSMECINHRLSAYSLSHYEDSSS